MKRWSISLIAILALGLIGGAAYWGFSSAQQESQPTPVAPNTVPVTRGDVQQAVVAPGQLVGTKEVSLEMGTAGQVAQVNVRPGDVVKAGDALAQLEVEPLQEALEAARDKLARAQAEHERRLQMAELDLKAAKARLEKTRLAAPVLAAAAAALKNAQDNLAKVKAGATPEELAEAQRRLAQAKNSRWGAQAARDEACSRGGSSTCAGAEAAVLNAELEVQAAELKLQRLQAGPDPKEVAAAEAELQAAQEAYDVKGIAQTANRLDLETAEDELRRCTLDLEALKEGLDPAYRREVEHAQEALDAATLRAPFDGAVLEVKVRPGDSVMAGTMVCILADPSAVEARTTVIEEDLPLVQVGQEVEVSFDARPEVTLRGHVARIVPQRVPGDRSLFPVYITLDEPTEGLLPGMTVDASITIAQRSNVLRLPRALVRAGTGGTAQVKVWADGIEQKRTVKVGLRGDVYVEILEGLREGEQVVGQ